MAAGRPQDTVVVLAPAFQDDKLSTDGLDLLGSAYSKLEMPADAARVLRRAHERRPDDWKTAMNLGVALSQSGDLAGAENVLRPLAQAHPNEPAVLQNLAAVLQKRGHAEADRLLARAKRCADRTAPALHVRRRECGLDRDILMARSAEQITPPNARPALCAGRRRLAMLHSLVRHPLHVFRLGLVLAGALAAGSALAYPGGPPDGFAGNPPSFNSCVLCHGDFELNSGNGGLELLGLPSAYAAGATYDLTVRLRTPTSCAGASNSPSWVWRSGGPGR
jgi:tetratricopeptide (TPR) repeat protein